MTDPKPDVEREREEGEIKVLLNGDVIIGAPTASAFGEASPPGGDEEK